MNTTNKNILVCTLLVLVAVFSRIISNEFHLWNFAVLGAISLFSGAVLRNKSYAYILPIAAYLLSDIYFEITAGTGFYDLSQFFVYGAMGLIVLLGSKMKNRKVWNVLGFSIASAVVFFIVSNFGVWVAGFFPGKFTAMYPTTLEGLVSCFTMAVPFFKNTLISDVLFSGMLFGAYSLYQSFSKNEKAVVA